MKELIIAITQLLNNIATLLHGDPGDRRDKVQNEELVLLYCALKTLANAKNIEQVLDAVGFYSESIDLTVDGQETIYGNVLGLLEESEALTAKKCKEVKESNCRLWDTENEKIVFENKAIVLSNDKENLRKALTETQVGLAEERDKNAILLEKVEELRGIVAYHNETAKK